MLGYLCWWNLGDVRVAHTELHAALQVAGFPVTLTPPTAHAVEQRVLRAAGGRAADLEALRAQYQDTHVAIDLTRLLGQIVERIPGAVGVRLDGGLVFAPPEALPDLLRVRTLIGSLPTMKGAAPALYLAAQADEPVTRADLAAAVTAGLLQDAAALEHDLLRLQVGGRHIRPPTLARRQAQVQAVARRVEAHAGLLGETQRAAVEAALTALERRLVGMGQE
jgi:hypothetical protein